MKYFIVSALLLIAFVCVGIVGYYLVIKPSALPVSVPVGKIATPFPFIHPSATDPSTIDIIFAGDVMLDRNIRLKAEKHGYDFLIGPQLRELLVQADTVVVNMEGPITANTSVSVGSEVGSTRNFLFTFDPQVVTFLERHNMNIVNLGNNHILNFGTEGLAKTYRYLDDGSIHYFGFTGSTQPPGSSTYIQQVGEYQIGFVNYNQFISGGEEQAFADIAKLSPQVDYLVMYTHWGNEYVSENQVIQNLAHRFIDAGVDLVIGSHPHVITGTELYKNKPIYYSLGNFIFDQYFEPAVRKGLLVQAQINLETATANITEYTVDIDPSGQTELTQQRNQLGN